MGQGWFKGGDRPNLSAEGWGGVGVLLLLGCMGEGWVTLVGKAEVGG